MPPTARNKAEKDAWIQHANLLAAILIGNTLGGSGFNEPEHVIQVWADMVRRLRRIDLVNPPTS